MPCLLPTQKSGILIFDNDDDDDDEDEDDNVYCNGNISSNAGYVTCYR